jgi:endo-1,4-beta-xylanase
MRPIRHTLAVALTALLVACGGGGGNGGSNGPPGGGGGGLPPPTGGGGGGLPNPSTAPALKTTLATRYATVDYPVGAAIEPASTTNADAPVLQKHYSSITAENAMKPDTIWPNAPGTSGATAMPAPQPNYGPADTLATFAFNNGMQLRGHTLLWHQTAPDWFFAGDRSNPANYRANVQQRLRDYITAVMTHFPNVYAWDVVNEVASDTPNDPNPYRTNSPWYQAYSNGGLRGADYVRDAFNFAFQTRAAIGRNTADMKLMINDYSTESAGKRANLIAIIQDLQSQGVVVDGVGHPFHRQLGADVNPVTAAFQAVEALPGNLVNHVTELDVSIYMDPGTCYSQRTIPPCLADYGASPPDSVLNDQARLYRALYNAFNRPSVTSITSWGIADNHTWLNSFPVTRTNRPLLFDTARDPKAAFWAVADPNFVIP